jgi:hypothetical protein
MPQITYLKAMIGFLLLLSLVACTNRSTVNDNGLQEINNFSNEATIDNQQSTQNENEPYFNQYLQRYEIVDGYSDGFLEIMGEKITFNGNGYQEISTPFLERIMFNAVRFYIAAAIEDFDTLKKMAGQELSSEIEKARGDSGNYPYKYGGDAVASFKDRSQYPKPISITAPIQTEENKYKVTLEYSNKENRRFIDMILDKQSNEIKIISFLNKP